MADVNLSVEVQSRGVAEATAGIQRLEAAGKSAARVDADLKAAKDALSGATAKMARGMGDASAVIHSLATRVGELKTAYTGVGVAMVGATASERLKAFGGTLDQGIVRARLLKHQMDALNANPIRDLMAVEEARSSRLSAQGNLEKARWDASLQGMTAAQRAAATLTRAENELATALGRVAAAQAVTANRHPSGSGAGGRFKSTGTDADIRAEAQALNQLAEAERRVGAARASSNAMMMQARGGVTSARAGLAAAQWQAELAGMTQVEAAQHRLTRATEQFARAKRLVVAVERAVSRNPSIENLNREAAAVNTLTRATDELRNAKQGLASANASTERAFDNDNAFQSSYSYFILAGLATQASQKIRELGTATITASREIERGFADVERTFEGTDTQLSALKKRLYELSTETPVSIIDLSEIAALGNQLGIAAADIEKFTTVIAQYTAVSGVSAEDAATAFGRISNLTGIAASEYDKLASSITYTARTTVATESTIQNTAKEITALASGAGLSASAIVGLAGALSSLAIPPERARGALSLYFGALNGAVSEGGPKLKAFADLTKLTASELDNLVRNNRGEEVFTAFIKGLAGLDTVAKTDALDAIGLSTIRVDQTMRALSQNVPLVTQALEGAHASYAMGTDMMNQYGIIQDTLDSKIIQFQNSIQNAAAAIGDNGGLSTALKLLVDFGTGAIKLFSQFASSPIGQAFMLWATAAMALAAGMAALVGVLALAKASMVVLVFAMKQLNWHTATSGLKLWTSNMLLGAGATNTAAASTATLAGASRTATASQLTLGAAARQSAAATFTAANGMRVLSAAMKTILPILAITLITAGIMKLVDAADKARNPVKNLGSDVDSLKQALMDDNIGLLAKGIEGAGTGANNANSKLSDFNQSVLSAIDVQRRAEEQIGKTNNALNGQEFALGSSADAWIDEAVKSSEALTQLIEGRSTWDNIRNLGMSAKTVADLNPGALVNGMLKATDVVSSDEFKSLLESGAPIKEVMRVGAEHGTEAGQKMWSEWATALTEKDPKLGDAASRFGLGVLPNLLKGVEDGFTKAGVQAALDASSAIDENGESAAATAADYRLLTAEAANLNSGLSATAFTFEGSTDRVEDFQNAIQGAMQGFVGFDAVLKSADKALKELAGDDKVAFGDKDLLPTIEVQAFAQGLSESIGEAESFYTNIVALAEGGSTAFALGLAELGPEAAGILAGALELDGDARAQIEANARLAGFLASDQFKQALESSMSSDYDAYSQIFAAPEGGIEKVKEFIAAQIAGTGAEWERQWLAENPTFPLNLELKGTPQEIIQMWADQESGKITVKAAVNPASRTIGDAIATSGEWQTFMNSETGASITLPADLDEATLAASLAAWQAAENSDPKKLAAALEEAGLSSSLAAWVSVQPAINLRAAVTPYLTQTLGDIALRGVVQPGGGRTGGLIDKQRYGDDKFPRFATGGGYKVTGPGSGISDSILARLSAGEYVNTKKSVDFWGADFFDSINRKMLPASMMKLLGAAAVSGNQGPSSVTNVKVVQNSPVTRDPLKQLREDSERVAAGIWG